MILPVTESITAPSVGKVTNAKVPPDTPVILAVAPSHVATNSNEESSPGRTVKTITGLSV